MRAARSATQLTILCAALMACGSQDEIEPADVRLIAPPIPQQLPSCEVGDQPFRILEIDAHLEHACAAIEPCGALCWGRNLWAESGVDNRETWVVSTPRWVHRALALRDISVGNRHTCAVSDEGGVYCWGNNVHEALGLPRDQFTDHQPVRVPGLPLPAVQVEAAGWGSCALLVDGSVYCWGSWATTLYAPREPTRVEGVEGAVSLGFGATHGCAIRDDGIVLCWGSDTNGMLGDGLAGEKFSRDDARPVLDLPRPAIELALVQDVSCAIVDTGDVYCWGSNADGRLGNGLQSGSYWATPQQVVELSDAVAMDIGLHACAASSDGALRCWGDDVFLPLPGVPGGAVLTPTLVAGIDGVTDVAIGFWNTCALTDEQDIYCWGANNSDSLGLGDTHGWVDVPTLIDWRSALE